MQLSTKTDKKNKTGQILGSSAHHDFEAHKTRYFGEEYIPTNRDQLIEAFKTNKSR